MNQPSNPYIAGTVIHEEKGFFGRLEILKRVVQEIRNPNTNALVLFGQRRIGKTSLLHQLQNTLPENDFLLF